MRKPRPRHRRLPDSSLVTRRLGEATHRQYAATSYMKRRGTPRTFADLAKHDAARAQHRR